MIQLFRGCKAEDMPPHIYSSAQSAYRVMLATRCDQSLVFTGRSGSGKTHNFRNSLHYLCIAAGCPSKIVTGKTTLKLAVVSYTLYTFSAFRFPFFSVLSVRAADNNYYNYKCFPIIILYIILP